MQWVGKNWGQDSFSPTCAESPSPRARCLKLYLLSRRLTNFSSLRTLSACSGSLGFLHANLSPSHAFTPSTLGRAKGAKTRHRGWVTVRVRHRRLAVFDGEKDMDVLHVQSVHPEEIYFEFSKSSAANHQLSQALVLRCPGWEMVVRWCLPLTQCVKMLTKPTLT